MTHTEIVTILNPTASNHEASFTHTDEDGDRLLVAPSMLTDGTPGIYFRSDPRGSSVPFADLPAFMAQLLEVAKAAQADADAKS